MLRDKRPALWLSTSAVVLITLIWGIQRLGILGDQVFPLTFVLPLLLCVWTRRPWQLWAMTVVSILIMVYKFLWLAPDNPLMAARERMAFYSTVSNNLIGALMVKVMMGYRERLTKKADRILTQNGELESQGGELARQNEEIRAQAEELAQQTEEIETQREILAGQNEELTHANGLLGVREEILETIMRSSRMAGDGTAALNEVCRRTLSAIGAPGEFLAVLEPCGEGFRQLAQSLDPKREGSGAWACGNSLASLVLRENRTAYVDDFAALAEDGIPAGENIDCRSALMTPVPAGDGTAGVMAVFSSQSGHWTQDQFRVLEWAAAQCGLLLESRRWQEALQERAAAVEAANKAKDHFLASLSHELRTPLTPVLAVTGLLEQDARLPEDVRADLEVIQRNIAVQSRLIDDLLDLTRIAKGRVDLDLQPVCVATLLRQSAEILSSAFSAAGVILDLRMELPLPALVYGDGARLQQVFWNILSNSLKFSPPDTTVTVTARLAEDGEDGVELSFRDQGPGILEEDTERIFQPFERATTVNSSGQGGLGLGLSIARAITELHEGRIEARPGGLAGGGWFVVRLPLAKDSPPPPSKASPSPSPKPESDPLKLPRILLVEDHEDTGRTLCRLLARRGYETVHARSCAEAIVFWSQGKFDLLVSDLGLPDGTGVDLLRQLREISPNLPAVCMSGYGMESDISRTLEAGFFSHLIKPVRIQNLEEIIQNVLKRDRR